MNEQKLISGILLSLSTLEMEIHNTPLTDEDLEIIEILSDARKTLSKAIALYKENRQRAKTARLEMALSTVKKSGLKQHEVAERIGCSPEHLNTVLRGKNTLTDELYNKIIQLCL